LTEGCGDQHDDLNQLYITRLKVGNSNDIVAICPACGELFDEDDFPELKNLQHLDVKVKP